MKIFISWSGELSKQLAEIFKAWLPGVIQAVKPYFSPDDITKGARWSTDIAKELEASRIGIICVTRDNLTAPWIMFEAGALSKNLNNSKVCPILFNVDTTDIEGPLVQFQAAKFTKEDIKRVVKMINQELGESALSSEVFDGVFDMWWPQLEKQVVEKIESQNNVRRGREVAIRSDRDLLEEILRLTRAVTIRPANSVRYNPLLVRDLIVGLDAMIMQAKSKGILVELEEDFKKFKRPIQHMIRNIDAGETGSSIKKDFDKILLELNNAESKKSEDESDLI